MQRMRNHAGSWLESYKEKVASRRVKMQLNLKLDYAVRPQELIPVNGQPSYWAEARQISEFVIRNAFDVTTKEKKDATAQKILGRVRNALTRALKNGTDVLDLDKTTVERILESVKAWAADPSSTPYQHWVLDLQDHLEALLEGEKKA